LPLRFSRLTFPERDQSRIVDRDSPDLKTASSNEIHKSDCSSLDDEEFFKDIIIKHLTNQLESSRWSHKTINYSEKQD
jgi:hypothetical protein